MLGLSGATLLSGCLVSESTPPPKKAQTVFNVMIDAFTPLVDSKTISGVSFGVKAWGHSPLIEHLGWADIVARQPISDISQFRIASITKPFIAVAILQMIEAGELDLDDSINRHLISFPEGDQITIRHLLSHTSGLRDWYETSIQPPESENWLMEPNPERVLASGENLFRFEPGSAHWYSNSGYVLLGAILSRVSDMSWIKYLEERLFAHVGLTDTSIENIGVTNPDWIDGYGRAPDDSNALTLTDFRFMPGAAGAMRSTVSDLLAWSDALWSGRMLSDRSLRAMTAMEKLDSGAPIYESSYFPLEFGERPAPPPNMQKAGWGLGVSLFRSMGKQIVWHSGGIGGFNSVWLNLPEEELSVVMLSNTENGAVEPFDDVLKALVV